MADSEGLQRTAPVSLAGSDEEEDEEGEMKNLAALMERLRNKEKTGNSRKPWHDPSKLFKHVISIGQDKRHLSDPEDKTAIQKELTLLTKTVKVDSISSLVDHLEQCGKLVSMTTATDSGRVLLRSDMFDVSVYMENSGVVKDVIITHDASSHNRDIQSAEELARQELTQLLSDNKFEEFTQHLQGLTAMFSGPGDRAQKTKAVLALQYLETDLSMLSKMQSTISSVANYIHKSPLGILQPRVGGLAMQVTYFVGPYDLLSPQDQTFCPMTVEAILEKKVGYRASIELRASSPHLLQTMPLIMDGKSIPSFSGLNKINSCYLPAVFVLKLHEQLPLSWSLMQSITAITGIEFTERKRLKSLMTLIMKHVKKKEALENLSPKGWRVLLPDQRHSYYLHPWPGGTEQEGALVTEIPFTHPTHVARILACLRQQVLFNTLVASCFRNASAQNLSGENCWTFELVPGSLSSLTVCFEHPCTDTIATVELDLTDVTAVRCHIVMDAGPVDGSTESLCTDEAATKVLQRCLSVPVTLRWILNQAILQLRQKLCSPSPEVCLETSHMSRTGQERRQAFIEAHLRNQLPWKHMNNMMRLYSTVSTLDSQLRNTTRTVTEPMELLQTPEQVTVDQLDQFEGIQTMDVEDNDKVSRNPMLASLLGQDPKSPMCGVGVGGDTSPGASSNSSLSLPPPPPPQLPLSQQHSMLSALLGDSHSPQSQLQQIHDKQSPGGHVTNHPGHGTNHPMSHPSQSPHLTHTNQSPLHPGQGTNQSPVHMANLGPPLTTQGLHMASQHPTHPPPKYTFPQPAPEKPPRKRKSVENRGKRKSVGDMSAPRGPKRKPSEEDMRRDLTLFNVDGSSSSTVETMSGKSSPSLCKEPRAVTPSASTLTSSYPNRVSDSHVNRLASTVDSIIKQEARVVPSTAQNQTSSQYQVQATTNTNLASHLYKDSSKRFKSESDSSREEIKSELNTKYRSFSSDCDGSLTTGSNKASLKTTIKTERPDPFDFSASLPLKDSGLGLAGTRAIKKELISETSSDFLHAHRESKKESDKHNVSFEKTDSSDSKSDNVVRWKERTKKEKRESRDLSIDKHPELKDKPLAITVKVNTRDLTSRTIFKESPHHTSSPHESTDFSWKDKSRERNKVHVDNTIDLTGEGIESDQSSTCSTPMSIPSGRTTPMSTPSGRTTPMSNPSASPRLLHVIKPEPKEKSRGEKRRKSSKHVSSSGTDKKHKKSDEARKELSKKQRIYDFDADINESDNYCVEKLTSMKPTTIKIRAAGKVSSHSLPSAKNSPLSRSSNTASKSPSSSPSPLKIIRSVGENSKTTHVVTSRHKSNQKTYSRSKSVPQGVLLTKVPGPANSVMTPPASEKDKSVDTKLYKTPTIKLKPLNIPSTVSISLAQATNPGSSKTTQAPSSAPIAGTGNKSSLTTTTTTTSSLGTIPTTSAPRSDNASLSTIAKNLVSSTSKSNVNSPNAPLKTVPSLTIKQGSVSTASPARSASNIISKQASSANGKLVSNNSGAITKQVSNATPKPSPNATLKHTSGGSGVTSKGTGISSSAMASPSASPRTNSSSPALSKPTGGATPSVSKPTGGATPAVSKPTGGATPAVSKPTGGATTSVSKPTGGAAASSNINSKTTAIGGTSNATVKPAAVSNVGNLTPKSSPGGTSNPTPKSSSGSASNVPKPVGGSAPNRSNSQGNTTPKSTTSGVPLTGPLKPSNTSANASTKTSTTNSTAKSAKNIPKSKKQLSAVIDKLKKQQSSSPVGEDQPTSKKSLYDAIRLQIIREGNRPSNASKDLGPSILKSSHIKKIDSSAKSESFKKTDFKSSGAMPSVSTTFLGTIPKTSSHGARPSTTGNSNSVPSSKSTSASTPTSTMNKSVMSDHSNKASDSNNSNKNNSNSSSNVGKIPHVSTNSRSEAGKVESGSTLNRGSTPGTTRLNSDHANIQAKKETEPKPRPEPEVKPRADAHFHARDPRTLAQFASKANNITPSSTPPRKDTSTPERPTPVPAPVKQSSKPVEDLQKGPRHFLDAVKLPVNGSEDSQDAPSEKSGVSLSPGGSTGDKLLPAENPNHEIFMEAPESPTEEEMLAAPAPLSFTGSKRPSPTLETSTEGRLTPKMADSVSDKPRVMPLNKDLNKQEWTRATENASWKAPLHVKSTEESPSSPPSLGKPESDTSDIRTSQSAYPAPAVSELDTPASPDPVASPDSQTDIDSGPLTNTVSAPKTIPTTKTLLSSPSSPVSSPEDGLVIDCPGDPHSPAQALQSPATLSAVPSGLQTPSPRATPSPRTNASPRKSQSPTVQGQSPALRGQSPALDGSHKTNMRGNINKPLPSSSNKLMNNHSGSSTPHRSPVTPYRSPVHIDDDLMDAALIL